MTANESDTSSGLSETNRPLLDEFPEKGGDNIEPRRTYGRQTFWTRIGGILKWPLLISCYTVLILVLQHVFYLKTASFLIAAGRDVNGIVPEYTEMRTFRHEEADLYNVNHTSEAASIAVRERWRLLFPVGNGQVTVEHPEDGPYLLNPLISKSGKAGYFISWVHQLHCLYIIMDAYDEVVQFGIDGNEAFEHQAHCFEYLRQTILCNMDSTLEGTVDEGGSGKQFFGMGDTRVCRSYQHGKAWAERWRQNDDLTLGFDEKDHRIGNGGARPGIQSH